MVASAPHAQIEAERLAALDAYDVLDTPQEGAFDRITRLVTRLSGVPVHLASHPIMALATASPSPHRSPSRRSGCA